MDPNIFREYDIRGIVGRHLTGETVATLALGIGTFFRQNGAKRIAIGYDARESSPGFCEVLTRRFRRRSRRAPMISSPDPHLTADLVPLRPFVPRIACPAPPVPSVLAAALLRMSPCPPKVRLRGSSVSGRVGEQQVHLSEIHRHSSAD